MKHHPDNTNLRLFTSNFFNGNPVQQHRGPLVQEYLHVLETVIQTALNDNARVFAFRVDLRLPDWYNYQGDGYANAVIERFIASLKAKIENNRERALANRPYAHQSRIRYVWTREFTELGRPHYHLLILLNNDAFTSLGDFNLGSNNMYNRVVEAWGSALKCHPGEIETLVHFPENPMYRLRRGDLESYQDIFYRASYFCKADTKQYRDRGHAFGSSRC